MGTKTASSRTSGKNFDSVESNFSNDDDSSTSSSAETKGIGGALRECDRNEEEEIRKFAEKETKRIRIWRWVVTAALFITGFMVSYATYYSLEQEENQKFDRAFDQFSNTIVTSALQQQENIRVSFEGMADMISSAAYVQNTTWPFYTFSRFEQLAYDVQHQSNTESLVMIHKVTGDQYDAWIGYANKNHEVWVNESYIIQGKREKSSEKAAQFEPINYHPYMTQPTNSGLIQEASNKSEYWPAWTSSPPPPDYTFINMDIDSVPDFELIIDSTVILEDQTLFTRFMNVAKTLPDDAEHAANHAADSPHSLIFHPLQADPDDEQSEMVAIIIGKVSWDAVLTNILPHETAGIVVVIKNSCDQSATFLLDGPDAIYLGNSDLHDTEYDSWEVVAELSTVDQPANDTAGGYCVYTMYIYPTDSFESTWDTDHAENMGIFIACTFFVVICVFFVYDRYVQNRNEKLVANSARTSAIVNSLFPSNIRDKLIVNSNNSGGNLRAFMDGKLVDGKNYSTAAMADLFLETTIMFADIVGFTAWSSVREPCHVFNLLESLYSSFDEIARMRRVFKVETVGDCYVAATGMPDPNPDHAIAMCRFARDVLKKTSQVTKELEVTLGPDTGDLALRIGIHSGPVTAGVLRGDKARFQLFGDTMNVTARIESNGMPGRIHLSQETADILISSGKGHMLERREEKVQAKGKGLIQTYWLKTDAHRNETSSSTNGSTSATDNIHLEVENVESKTRRLIEWNVESLLRILKQIVALRVAKGESVMRVSKGVVEEELRTIHSNVSFLDEVKEIITLPEFDAELAAREPKLDAVEVPPEAVEQLREYVSCIASMYRPNPFHNFEHASHVTMSVLKLLSRIVAPSDMEGDDGSATGQAATMHDHTYGITSDPLTQFACAFSALIHDVDHTGAPNAQLVKEGLAVAAAYNNRSVAEQNSLSIAWHLLMDERFHDLRSVIYIDAAELTRFRQLVVNAVMATDIVDKDLKALRNGRWEKAFSTCPKESVIEDPRDAVNRKATIVIEHLIQASDVAHTMQHWHVYRKWNERFFKECYVAYLNGRAEQDPADNWYKGEIGFFDYYIIPLAKKLQDCGVFGKSSDEYLNYALKNRQEWEARGEEVVAEMKQAVTLELRPAQQGTILYL